jgi:hypothetical protein
MKAIEWNRLTEITRLQKPYRGTTNRFPIGKRTHNTKCFYLEERDGEKVYVITYGTSWQEFHHTKEEYEANAGKGNIHCRDWDTDESTRYVSYIAKPRELGIVRSDNTFEFTNMGYGQGDNQIMSNWSYGWFFRSSRHGGMVYKSSSNGKTIFHPIFKGMRINCEDMSPAKGSEYKVVGRRVSRKYANEFLKRYEDFYKVNEVMFKTIEMDNFIETAVDVANECGIDFNTWSLQTSDKDKLVEFANKSLDSAPLDSCSAFALAYNIQDTYSRVRHKQGKGSHYYRSEIDLETLFSSIKRKLNKELYKANPSVMKTVDYTPHEYYPPSEWGVEIFVNGKEVEQY